tara:strand:+ start:17311 stop:18252 length:942 start_codon:yes stop_codon:yes gene_type:complete
MDDILFITSFFMLFYGGELLVRSSVGLSLRFRISELVIGLTVVSFATSAPELFISIQSTLQSLDDITLGNVIGSNIANITLVLGITSILTRINITKQTLTLNFPVMIFSTIIFSLLLYYLCVINIFIGILFVIFLGIFIYYLIKSSKRNYNNFMGTEFKEKHSNESIFLTLFNLTLGVFLLSFGSNFLINGVERIAELYNISERLISISIVAFGTSIPELATSIVAAIKKHSNLAIGNLIGSNIFNILAVIGITSIVSPIELIDKNILLDLIWMICSMLLLGFFIYFYNKNSLGRIQGFFLLVFYVFYIFIIY